MAKRVLDNDLLLRALALRPTERVPLWIMRQAGRYLPEYRRLRKQAGSFLRLCRTPELACEAAMQPLARYGLDAAIVFSDILVIPDAFGLELNFVDGEGPRLGAPVQSERAVAALGELDLDKVAYVPQAVEACSAELAGKVPLIGFAGGPFTLACYMISGRGGEFLPARRMLHARPDLFAQILHANAAAAAKLLAAQAQAGADVLMVFESWAGLVPDICAQSCLFEPLGRLVAGLQDARIDAPLILFMRGAGHLNEQASNLGVSALGVDWRSDLNAQSRTLAGKVAVQGNLDPAVLLADEATVRACARATLARYAAQTGHIFNLGAGIDRATPPENVAALVDEVRTASAAHGSGAIS